MLKVVIDANVWVSSLLADGNARRIRERFEAGQFQVCFAEELLAECRDVMARPKFRQQITPTQSARLLALIQHMAILVELPSAIPPVSRDPKDDPLLACVAAVHCDFLVTGDKDLLSLTEYEGAQIVSPARFLEILGARS